jgi:excisionase family DNA binding protein
MPERLRIGTVAAILGVSLDTLRRWEADGEVVFERTAGGQRVLGADVVRGCCGSGRDRRSSRPATGSRASWSASSATG